MFEGYRAIVAAGASSIAALLPGAAATSLSAMPTNASPNVDAFFHPDRKSAHLLSFNWRNKFRNS